MKAHGLEQHSTMHETTPFVKLFKQYSLVPVYLDQGAGRSGVDVSVTWGTPGMALRKVCVLDSGALVVRRFAYANSCAYAIRAGAKN